MGHQHRVRLREWLSRRKDYGTSAATLEQRHPGAVRPLYASAWTAAAWPPAGRSPRPARWAARSVGPGGRWRCRPRSLCAGCGCRWPRWSWCRRCWTGWTAGRRSTRRGTWLPGCSTTPGTAWGCGRDARSAGPFGPYCRCCGVAVTYALSFLQAPAELGGHDDVIPGQLADGGPAEREQRRVDAAAEHVEDVLDAGRTVRGQPPQVGAADHDRPRAQRERLDHVAAAPDPAVEQHLDLPAHGVGHAGQGPDRGRGAVQVVAAVVGHRDRGGPDVDGTARVVGSHDALDHERAAPLLAQPGDVVPGRRRGLHPLAVHAEERGRRLARGGHVGHGEVGQAAVEEPFADIARLEDALGGQAYQGPQVHLLRYRRAAPVPAVGERPVQGDDQALGAGLPGPLHPLDDLVPGA